MEQHPIWRRNVSNCILWVGRQLKLDILRSYVFADDDGTTILKPVERIEDIEACKKSLSV